MRANASHRLLAFDQGTMFPASTNQAIFASFCYKKRFCNGLAKGDKIQEIVCVFVLRTAVQF